MLWLVNGLRLLGRASKRAIGTESAERVALREQPLSLRKRRAREFVDGGLVIDAAPGSYKEVLERLGE